MDQTGAGNIEALIDEYRGPPLTVSIRPKAVASTLKRGTIDFVVVIDRGGDVSYANNRVESLTRNRAVREQDRDNNHSQGSHNEVHFPAKAGQYGTATPPSPSAKRLNLR